MSAVALLDISGAEPQWGDIMARFTTLPLAADFEDPLDDPGPSRSLPDPPAPTLQSQASAPVPGYQGRSREGVFGAANGFSGSGGAGGGVPPASAFAQAAGSGGGAVDKRSMVPMAAAMVDRLKRSGWESGWVPQHGAVAPAVHNARSFQDILEGASVLLAQVVSLGSLLGSAGGRLQHL